MWEQLAELLQKYNELTERLASGELKPSELQVINKERTQIEPIVEAYQNYLRLQLQKESSEQLLKESDADIKELAREEITQLNADLEDLEQQIKVLLLPRDPLDQKNVILEIRAGTGGDEAALFALELFQMYARFSERMGFKVELMNLSEGSKGGAKEVIATISGNQVYAWFKYEAGVHRVQRVPETETQGRIHTSAVTVAILPEAEEIDIRIEDKDLRIDVFRSGGPGGQSVNTTDSAVRITHIPTGLVVQCQDEKSQLKNKSKAMKVLRARLYERKQAELAEERAAERKSMVKTGDRSDKIRTYNFPQDRMTDHRVGLTVHHLPKLFAGDLMDFLTELRALFQAQALSHFG